MSALDSDLVRHALSVAREQGFSEVELAVGEDRFEARLSSARGRTVSASAKDLSSPSSVELAPAQIVSPLVGYYREAPKALKVGAVIKQGDVVAVIAALGIANEVESKHSGEILEVLVTPDQAVQYGQPLATVKLS